MECHVADGERQRLGGRVLGRKLVVSQADLRGLFLEGLGVREVI